MQPETGASAPLVARRAATAPEAPSPGPRGPKIAAAAVLAFALLGPVLVYDHMRLDSATVDEPFHALAAAEYVLGGTYYANLEHPPLAKLLSGLSLRAAGARAPRIERPLTVRPPEQPMSFCYGNAISPERLFAAARRPFPALLALLVAVAALLSWWLAGPVHGPLAAVGTAAFLALEPNHVAHAGVLHTDVPASLLFLATSFAALLAVSRRSFAAWGVCGVVLGLALAAKFSSVLLLPAVALTALFAALRAARERSGPGRVLLGAGLAFLLALATLLSAYAFAMRDMTRDEAADAARFFLRSRSVPAERIETFARLAHACPPLSHYLAGLEGIRAQDRGGGGFNVLHGRLSVEGSWDYFFVALGIKSSLGLLALVLVATALLLLRRARLDAPLALIGLPGLLLFLQALSSSYNIGIRHLLPVYSAAIVVAAVLVVRSLPATRAAVVLASLAALQGVETFRSHPHEMSFFNALVGGPSGGAAWLNDSNLDWGQDLKRLGIELRRRGWEARTTVAYFGGGFPPRECPTARVFDDLSPRPAPEGIYAVSSYAIAALSESRAFRGDFARAAAYARLRQAVQERGEKIGQAGYSILVYRLGPPPP